MIQFFKYMSVGNQFCRHRRLWCAYPPPNKFPNP